MNPSTSLRNPQQKPNGESTLRNSQQLGATQHVLDPYTVYVSGNYVVKFYDEYADVSKHYYAGGQRIASKLWQWQYNPTANPSQDPITPIHPPAVQNNIVLEDLWDVISLWDSVLGTETPTLQELQHMQLPTRAPYQTELCAHYAEEVHPDIFPHDLTDSMSTLDHINCLCRNGQTAYVWQNYGVSCHNFEELYFYHPDYLSNTEYVTDAGGYVYQYLFYSPFGESLYAQHAQTGEYNTPHRFNVKELDPEPTEGSSRAPLKIKDICEQPTEGSSRTPLKIKDDSEHTGNYYYGARYYNPRVSVWLSVDPLASWYPNKTPYNFSGNNPIMIIDPNGKWEQDADGNWVAQKGDSWWSLHKDAGISWKDAKQVGKSFNQARGFDNWKSVRIGDNISLSGAGNESDLESSNMPSSLQPVGINISGGDASNSRGVSSKNGLANTSNDGFIDPSIQFVSNFSTLIETFSTNATSKNVAGAVASLLDIGKLKNGLMTTDFSNSQEIANFIESSSQTAVENVFGPAMPAVNLILENGKDPEGLTNLNNGRMQGAYNTNKNSRDAYTQIMMYQNGTHPNQKRK